MSSEKVTSAEEPVIGHWRTGRTLGRTLYLDDKLVGMLDTEELAREVVGRMNGPRREFSFAKMKEELASAAHRIAELEAQLAEVRERDATPATEFSQLSDSFIAEQNAHAAAKAELETLTERICEAGGGSHTVDDALTWFEIQGKTRARYREAFLSICADVLRLPVPPGKDPDAWCREQVGRMSRNFDGEIAEHARHHEVEDRLRAELAAEREMYAVNRKARIVSETAARWVQEKRDRADRASSSTPWILAVEKELADDVQAYEWAVKEVRSAVSAVAETAEKQDPSRAHDFIECPDGYVVCARCAGNGRVARYRLGHGRAYLHVCDKCEGSGSVPAAKEESPPASAPVARLTREEIATLKENTAGTFSVYGVWVPKLRMLLAAAERDLARHEKEQTP
jgi:hypothetical protein